MAKEERSQAHPFALVENCSRRMHFFMALPQRKARIFLSTLHFQALFIPIIPIAPWQWESFNVITSEFMPFF
jgi:hypothetical protein